MNGRNYYVIANPIKKDQSGNKKKLAKALQECTKHTVFEELPMALEYAKYLKRPSKNSHQPKVSPSEIYAIYQLHEISEILPFRETTIPASKKNSLQPVFFNNSSNPANDVGDEIDTKVKYASIKLSKKSTQESNILQVLFEGTNQTVQFTEEKTSKRKPV